MKTGSKLNLAWSVLAETFAKWNEHKAVRLGAALAYFAIFAIAPVLIIAIAIAGLVYGRAGAEGNIVRSISGVVGSSTAQFVQGLVESTSRPGADVIAAVELVEDMTDMFLYGDSRAFGDIQIGFHIKEVSVVFQGDCRIDNDEDIFEFR